MFFSFVVLCIIIFGLIVICVLQSVENERLKKRIIHQDRDLEFLNKHIKIIRDQNTQLSDFIKSIEDDKHNQRFQKKSIKVGSKKLWLK